MDSRRILGTAPPLGLILDTRSLEWLLESGDTAAQTLLSYRITPHFEYTRTPVSCRYQDLQLVDPYRVSDGQSDSGRSVTVNTREGCTTSALTCGIRALTALSAKLGEDPPNGTDEGHAAFLPLIAGALNRFGRTYLAVTADDRLLRERAWLESHIPGVPINIVTVQEAMEIMDLFAKSLGKYHVAANSYSNKGLWYWYSLRSRVPHYQVEDGILSSLAIRLTSVLMAIDEMGKQYYLGVNNDTMRDTLYHFYYFVMLASGTLDSLATKANEQYRLGFDEHLQRVSLKPDTGKDFLRALREKNGDLRTFVNRHVDFIKLVFLLRDGIVHSHLPQETSYHWTDRDGVFLANFLWLGEEAKRLAESCGDAPRPFDRISEWGLLGFAGDVFVEPFHFGKQAGDMLARFVDGYLGLIGLSDWVNETGDSPSADMFRAELRSFRSNRIGF